MTQSSQLAVSGIAVFGLGWNFLAVGVLLMATLTLGTIVSVIWHRVQRTEAAQVPVRPKSAPRQTTRAAVRR
ncbi:hypothetical protein [Nesterenkonia sp. Act20]|uniref:hypothetical protein n=1 Tax=Nesterenkonia sp. Act20 TaxID=1483432 RepID=UPI001C452EEF|nr:hypothetical protein [Nesterenkonia sp. Act20]